MTSLIEGLDTKSSKIRKLYSNGFAKADIARFLNIRYQHVRNVLLTPLKTKVEEVEVKKEDMVKISDVF